MRGAGAQAALAVLSLLANLLGYGFTLVMSRALPVERFGELSALVGVLVVACVAGTALQADLARRIAAGTAREPARLLADAGVVAVAVALVVLVVSPVLWVVLDIGSWASLWWLAVAMVPTTVAFGVQGLLQGEDRLVRLGVVLALVQLAKFGAGVVAALLGGSITVAFALVAAFTAVVAVAVVPLARAPRAERLDPGPITPGRLRRARPSWDRASASQLLRDVGAVLGVLVLTSLDLLLARVYLSGRESGLYAAGNVVTRAAFWGPMFVALAAYPRLSDPATRGPALRRAVATLAVVAAVTIGGAALLRDLLPVLLGADYEPVTPLAWVFAVQGALLAAVQLGIYAGLAVHDRRGAVALWVVALAEVVVVATLTHDTVRSVILTSTTCSLVLVVVLVVLGTLPRRRAAAPAGQWAAASQVGPTPTETSSGTAPRA